MPLDAFRDEFVHRRRTSLLSFYMSAFLSAISLTLVGRAQSYRVPLLSIAVVAAALSLWLLLRFLKSNDERERLINYRALTFAFVGTLVFALAFGLLQSFGFHPISWLGIPVLMIILWSIGLILYSWRYQ